MQTEWELDGNKRQQTERKMNNGVEKKNATLSRIQRQAKGKKRMYKTER